MVSTRFAALMLCSSAGFTNTLTLAWLSIGSIPASTTCPPFLVANTLQRCSVPTVFMATATITPGICTAPMVVSCTPGTWRSPNRVELHSWSSRRCRRSWCWDRRRQWRSDHDRVQALVLVVAHLPAIATLDVVLVLLDHGGESCALPPSPSSPAWTKVSEHRAWKSRAAVRAGRACRGRSQKQ
jgi:hypothetical protein